MYLVHCRWALTVTTIALLCAVTSGQRAENLAITPDQWREDLEFIKRELPQRHKNAFHYTTRERFESSIANLEHDVDHLNADEVFVGIKRILSSIGDGHTGVDFPSTVTQFPVWFSQFGDETRVIAAADGLEKALGAQLLGIDGVSVDRVRALLQPLTAQDELPSYRLRQATIGLNIANLLHGLGIIHGPDTAQYNLRSDRGEEFTVEARAVPSRELAGASRHSASSQPTLASQKPNEHFWFTLLPSSATVYCDFRRYDELHDNARSLLRFIEQQHADRLIIDLRQNPGGDYKKGFADLVKPISENARLTQKGHLFVLIGPATFSAAMVNAIQFRQFAHALLVGQPIGEKPNSYAEKREMKLPNSGLTITYSHEYYEFAKNGENVVRPDQEVSATWKDFIAGRDPAIDWIMTGQIIGPAR